MSPASLIVRVSAALLVGGCFLLPQTLRAYAYWTSSPSTVPSGTGYTIGAQVEDYYYWDYTSIDIYRQSNWVAGSSGYGNAYADAYFTDNGAQSIGYSADAYSYYGGYEWLSHTVTIQAASQNPTAWVEIDGQSHNATVARPSGGSLPVTVRFKATDPDGNLTGIRPQVWNPQTGYFNNNNGTFIGQSGGSGEVTWTVQLNADGDWYFWTDAQDTNLASTGDYVDSGAWGSGYRLAVVQAANQIPDAHFDWSTGSLGNGQTLQGNGWAADPEDGAPVNRVEVFVNSTYLGNASLGGHRPDVASYFGRSDYTYSGFSFGFTVNSLSFGNHTVMIRAYDNGGNYRELSRSFTIANVTPTTTLLSPSAQTIQFNTALTLSSQAIDPDGNLIIHNLDIQRPNGAWNFQGGFASGEPFIGGPVGSASNSTRTASFTFNELGTWNVRSYSQDSANGASHSATVAITVVDSLPPPVPGFLQVSGLSGTGFTLGWTQPNSPSGISGYQVRLNEGTPVSVSGLSYAFSGLSAGVSYGAQVRAQSGNGQWSGWTGVAVTTSSGQGGGGGTSQSIWVDVDGDGIFDELVRAGTTAFDHWVEQWYTYNYGYLYYPINSYWIGADVSFLGSLFTDFARSWAGSIFWEEYETYFDLMFRVQVLANEPIQIFRDETGNQTVNPSLWESIINVPAGFSTAGAKYLSFPLDGPDDLPGAKYFLVKKGLPVGSTQLTFPGGATVNVGANGLLGTLGLPGGSIFSAFNVGGTVTLPGGISVSVSGGEVTVSTTGVLPVGSTITTGGVQVHVDVNGNARMTYPDGMVIVVNVGGGGQIAIPGGAIITVSSTGTIGVSLPSGSNPVLAKLVDLIGRVLSGNSLNAAVWVIRDLTGAISPLPGPVGDALDILAATSGGQYQLGIDRGPSLPIIWVSKRPKVGLVRMWETKNKANQIYNPTPKDDHWELNGVPQNGVPRNTLYMVVDPEDLKYKVTVQIDVPSQHRTKMIAAVFTPELGAISLVPNSERAFNVDGIATLEFAHFTPSGLYLAKPYFVRVGYDMNNNNQLDPNEVGDFVVGNGWGEPIIRGSSASWYDVKREFIQLTATGPGGWLAGQALPHARANLRIFFDGNPSQLALDKRPTVTPASTIQFDAFNGQHGELSEWLTHNSGAQFDYNGLATIRDYEWDNTGQQGAVSHSEIVADSLQVTQAVSAAAGSYYNNVVAPLVSAYFASNPSSESWVYPGPDSTEQITQASQTLDLDSATDINFAIGRTRLLPLFARYHVKKQNGVIIHDKTYIRGEVIDLYDFNYEQGLLPSAAAALQIGYGNGSYTTSGSALDPNGRDRGIIYRYRIKFKKEYLGPGLP